MSEIRLTFRAEDFGPVSQMLVEMGVGFRVDPLKGAEEEAPREKAPVAATPRKVGKKGRKSTPMRSAPKAEGVSAVDRLREAIIRNQASGSLAESGGKPDE